MELSDLAIFAAVAKCGGITRAAAQVNTVQSNVTTRVQALEEEIGVALFERHSRGVTLTAAGKRLLPYAERLASISREAILAARDDGVPKGPLAIGSMETTAAVRLPPMLAGFHQDYPLVDLSLQTAPTAALVQSVLDGRLDGAFVAGPIEHPDLVATRAFSEELVLITASRWKRLSALQQAKRATGLTILVFRTGCTYRQKLEHILNEMGWPCGSRLEMGTLDGIIGCVAADNGCDLAAPGRLGKDEPERQHPDSHLEDSATACRHALHQACTQALQPRARMSVGARDCDWSTARWLRLRGKLSCFAARAAQRPLTGAYGLRVGPRRPRVQRMEHGRLVVKSGRVSGRSKGLVCVL